MANQGNERELEKMEGKGTEKSKSRGSRKKIRMMSRRSRKEMERINDEGGGK